ncbi:MAG: NADH-quinone oxidoreductase subunit NuoI [Actinobacteria bacterium]|nr:NADH-quinone oxidoreductase subunit NuoI [Actinomycetota bacterium]
MGLKDAVKKGAFVDILRGMSVTGTYFVVDKVTVEYPKEKLHTYPRFRGAQALLLDPETGDTKCVACMLCATICPSRCITVVGEQTPEGRSHPASFELDLSRCVFCGMCEEVCPVAAIVMTRRYELATFDKGDFLLTKEKLIANQEWAHKEVFARSVEAASDNEAIGPEAGDAASGGNQASGEEEG